jgi:hypothetical protein
MHKIKRLQSGLHSFSAYAEQQNTTTEKLAENIKGTGCC